jgi:hypothetical protein
MNIECRLSASNLDDEALHDLSYQLSRTLNEENDIDSRIASRNEGSHAKGDPMALATLAITLLSTPAILALIKSIGEYITRNRSLEVEISRSDGAKVAVKANDLSAAAQERTQQMLENFLNPTKP